MSCTLCHPGDGRKWIAVRSAASHCKTAIHKCAEDVYDAAVRHRSELDNQRNLENDQRAALAHPVEMNPTFLPAPKAPKFGSSLGNLPSDSFWNNSAHDLGEGLSMLEQQEYENLVRKADHISMWDIKALADVLGLESNSPEMQAAEQEEEDLLNDMIANAGA